MRLLLLWLGISSVAFAQAPKLPISNPAPGQLAIGGTRYVIEGVVDPVVIDGFLVGSKDSGPTRKLPFGYVRVFPPEGSRVVVRAEAKDRTRLLAEKFGDGYRINHVGPVWIDIEVYQTFTIEDNEIEFLTQRGEIQFTVEGKKPDEPDQDDDDDDNDDGSVDSPFSADGLQVLFVYDTDKILPTSQTEILFGGNMLDYLDKNCVKLNNQPAYRVLDKDTTGPSSSEFIKALELPRDSIPWLIVGNGDKGFSGPLPMTVAETTAILERFK